MEASGAGYEVFARQGQVCKRSWTPRKGNEVLIRFHSGVQKSGFISKSVTCGCIFANPVVIPSRSSHFSTELKFRLLHIWKSKGALLCFWNSGLGQGLCSQEQKLSELKKEQVISLTFGHQKNLKHLRFIPQIQVRFCLCWTFGWITGKFTNWPTWSHSWQWGLCVICLWQFIKSKIHHFNLWKEFFKGLFYFFILFGIDLLLFWVFFFCGGMSWFGGLFKLL